jgi:hypothetical protein
MRCKTRIDILLPFSSCLSTLMEPKLLMPVERKGLCLSSKQAMTVRVRSFTFRLRSLQSREQGEVIRVQKIPFRYNWESVVTPVTNYALNQSMVDQEKVALMGIIFGGYLAPRAVAFECRIKACIANGGVYDFGGSILQRVSPDIEDILSDENKSKAFDREILKAMDQSVEIGWAVGNGMYIFGARTPSDYFRMLPPYTLKDVAPQIRCDMLVIETDNDTLIPDQARPLYDALTSPKKFMFFTS